MPEFGPRGKAMRYALAVIDRIHSDGQLPQIPANTDATINSNGYYEWDPAERKIVIDPSGPHPELTCLHEIGHLLDDLALDSAVIEPGQMASEQSLFLERWWQAAQQSQAIRDLRNRKSAVFHRVSISESQTTPVIIEQNDVDYYLEKPEVFARCYAQFITTTSRDEVLSVQLNRELSSVEWQVYPTQWREEDFEPIKATLTDLFRQKGWMK